MAEPEGKRAVRVAFNLREMFPEDDPLSIPLLRLMAATNDARYIYRLLAATIADEEAGTEFDRVIRAGEFCYLLRMLAAHLKEAVPAFRDLHTNCRSRIESLLGPDAGTEGRRALEAVYVLFSDPSETGFERSVLEPIRNLWASHYKAQRFHEALGGAAHDDTELIACEDHALGRYTCVDELVSGYSLEGICATFGGVERVAERLNDLVVQLCALVDTILGVALEQRASDGARRAITEGMVTSSRRSGRVDNAR